uniref:Uncharacterized protein n=1 Tax=Timema poppense TaxID=170557 RepID=A0A7R9D1M1_TIMPO|nr:unnamed protein product [Timema poppensis]
MSRSSSTVFPVTRKDEARIPAMCTLETPCTEQYVTVGLNSFCGLRTFDSRILCTEQSVTVGLNFFYGLKTFDSILVNRVICYCGVEILLRTKDFRLETCEQSNLLLWCRTFLSVYGLSARGSVNKAICYCGFCTFHRPREVQDVSKKACLCFSTTLYWAKLGSLRVSCKHVGVDLLPRGNYTLTILPTRRKIRAGAINQEVY